MGQAVLQGPLVPQTSLRSACSLRNVSGTLECIVLANHLQTCHPPCFARGFVWT